MREARRLGFVRPGERLFIVNGVETWTKAHVPECVADDRTVVEWQLERPARAFSRVAVRCPHGYPAVTEQASHTDDGTPFPTTFWLTCPWLAAAISRLEAAGGVARWSAAAVGVSRARRESRPRHRGAAPSTAPAERRDRRHA